MKKIKCCEYGPRILINDIKGIMYTPKISFIKNTIKTHKNYAPNCSTLGGMQSAAQ
jgi:hypothetical protein